MELPYGTHTGIHTGGWGKGGKIVVFVSKIDPIFSPSHTLQENIVFSQSWFSPKFQCIIRRGMLHIEDIRRELSPFVF
jgi:hypothetical protein